MATDPAVEAAYQAIRQGARGGCSFEMVAESVVSAVTPLIRAQAFTEAAEALKAVPGSADFRFLNLIHRASAISALRGLGEETENA